MWGMLMKVVYIRVEKGKVIETSILDGDLKDIAKKIAREALEEWNPSISEFIVLRDEEEITFKLPISDKLMNILRELPFERKNDKEIVLKYPYYTISFDNRKIDDDYIEYKVILIGPYIDDDFTTWLETLAANITSEKSPPEGIEEL